MRIVLVHLTVGLLCSNNGIIYHRVRKKSLKKGTEEARIGSSQTHFEPLKDAWYFRQTLIQLGEPLAMQMPKNWKQF